jgi:hsdS
MTTTIDNEQKTLNVPNLRFPEFEGEWEETRLKEISKFSKERLNSIELSCSNYVTTENMLQDYKGIVSATNLPTNTNVVKFSKGDVLLSNIRPYLKKVWYADKNGGCSADVFVFKALPICDSNFLHHVIANDRFIKFVMGGAKGVKMPRGDKEQMITYKVGLPCIEEQKKIANLLSILDERISTQNKIIEKLQSLIKGIRARLTQQVGGDFVYLSEIAQIYQPQTISLSELTKEGYLVYGANGVIGKYREYNHQTEQICITCRGNTCGVVNYTQPKSWITGNAMVINTNDFKEKVFKRYLYHYLSAYNFNRIISGSGQPQIVRSPLEKLRIALPTMQQQKNIATFLDKLQNQIEINNNILHLYLQQKQYLFRQMFI